MSARRDKSRGRRRSRSLLGVVAAAEEEKRGDEEEADEEIQRPRVPEDAADALYALRMKAVLRDFFKHWHAETVKRVVGSTSQCDCDCDCDCD